MNRKFINIILVLIFALSFVGCSKKNVDRSDIDTVQGYVEVIDTASILEKIENKGSFIFVLTQTSCSHCQEYLPQMLETAQNHSIVIYDIVADEDDADTVQTLLDTYELEETPTTVLVVEGKIIAKKVGKMYADDLEKLLKKHGMVE